MTNTPVEVVPWKCPTCRRTISTPFCPTCGERPTKPRELTLSGLFEQSVHAFTSVDGRLLRSFRALVTSPGSLTMAYLEGRRKPFIGPVPLFLLVNVLFFAVESLTGGTVFSTPLAKHLHAQPWDWLASPLVSHRLQTLHTTLDAYAPVFDRAVARNARSFIMLMALSFAVLPRVLFGKARRPFVVHAAFALHLYAFMLLLFCVATAFPDRLDAEISLALLAACAVYLYISAGVVYGGSIGTRVLKTVGLTVGAAAIVLGYRFTLLLVTLYTA